MQMKLALMDMAKQLIPLLSSAIKYWVNREICFFEIKEGNYARSTF
jgi:hypothetical protein